MKVIAAGKAKNGFGLLIDTALAEPVTIEKHGRPVAVMLSVEEYERLTARPLGFKGGMDKGEREAKRWRLRNDIAENKSDS
jgi:prevent-host-death family protein